MCPARRHARTIDVGVYRHRVCPAKRRRRETGRPFASIKIDHRCQYHQLSTATAYNGSLPVELAARRAQYGASQRQREWYGNQKQSWPRWKPLERKRRRGRWSRHHDVDHGYLFTSQIGNVHETGRTTIGRSRLPPSSDFCCYCCWHRRIIFTASSLQLSLRCQLTVPVLITPPTMYVCLFTCLFVNSKSYWRIWIKFCGMIDLRLRIKRLDFGTDQYPDLDTWSIFPFFCHWETGRFRH